eukprot:gb/GECG01015809.1/.p1 GENE.gb/GECG01015809.1/~~gb/GECG01015809.1/.p1  ORF type:complete len:169 (+),score=12.14 gb/GECG01015809.1/:1-507(+)
MRSTVVHDSSMGHSPRALEGLTVVLMTCYLWSSSLVAGVHVHPQRSLEEAKGNDGLVKGRSCGLSDPALKRELVTPATKVHQEYPYPRQFQEAGSRQLDHDFMPIQEAEEQGMTSEIRIRVRGFPIVFKRLPFFTPAICATWYLLGSLYGMSSKTGIRTMGMRNNAIT